MRCAHQRLPGQLKDLHRPLPGHRRKIRNKVVQRISSFQMIQEGLDWNSRVLEYGRPPENVLRPLDNRVSNHLTNPRTVALTSTA